MRSKHSEKWRDIASEAFQIRVVRPQRVLVLIVKAMRLADEVLRLQRVEIIRTAFQVQKHATLPLVIYVQYDVALRRHFDPRKGPAVMRRGLLTRRRCASSKDCDELLI